MLIADYVVAAIMLCMIYLAFWQKDIILFVISAIITIITASLWIDNYPGISIALFGMAVYQLLKVIIIMGEQLGPAKGFSQFKAMYDNARGRLQK